MCSLNVWCSAIHYTTVYLCLAFCALRFLPSPRFAYPFFIARSIWRQRKLFRCCCCNLFCSRRKKLLLQMAGFVVLSFDIAVCLSLFSLVNCERWFLFSADFCHFLLLFIRRRCSRVLHGSLSLFLSIRTFLVYFKSLNLCRSNSVWATKEKK